jgi:hypothetical protein
MHPPLEPIHTSWSIQNEKDHRRYALQIYQMSLIPGWVDEAKRLRDDFAKDYPQLLGMIKQLIIENET